MDSWWSYAPRCPDGSDQSIPFFDEGVNVRIYAAAVIHRMPTVETAMGALLRHHDQNLTMRKKATGMDNLASTLLLSTADVVVTT